MSAKTHYDADTLYNIAVHEAGHAVMAAYQGGFVTELAIGDMVEEEGIDGYCRTAVEGISAEQWITLAGPVVSAIHENTLISIQFVLRGGGGDFDSVRNRWLDLLVPTSIRAEFGFPEDNENLMSFVDAVLEGYRPGGAKGNEIRRIRRFARRCNQTLDQITDTIHEDAERIRQWILDEGWFMPRVYRLADVLVEKRKMETEEIIRWFIRDGEHRWLKAAA